MYKPPGMSDITQIKQDHFRLILRTHLRIVQAIFKKRRYSLDTFFYFDINCGPGVYESNAQKGSPLIFLEEVQRLPELKYSAVFIDKEKENINNLNKYIPPNASHIHVLCGEQAELLPQYFHTNKTQWHYGLLYTDPNGIFDAELLRDFSQQNPYHATDILINCPAAAIKRVRRSPKCQECRTLEDRLDIIQKKEWFVRLALRNSTWQWTFLLGTNWKKYPEFTKIDLINRTSKRGQSIFDILNYTNGERQEISQKDLFTPKFSTYRDYLKSPQFLQVKQQLFQRANGLCELCHDAPATDPHHVIYTDWRHGEDAPGNLLALCHPCHCYVHGKEN